MAEYKWDLTNFKKHFEKFSYVFLRLIFYTLFASFAFLYLFYKTKNDTFLLIFLIVFCGSLICLLVTLSHIDNLKRKNRGSLLKINYSKNIINDYLILKLTDYRINATEIELFGYFKNNKSDNLFNYQKYIFSMTIPRQFENEEDIINKLDIIKSNDIYEIDHSKYIKIETNNTLLLIVFLTLILLCGVLVLIYYVNFILEFVLVLVFSLLHYIFLNKRHKKFCLIFNHDCAEYERLYSIKRGKYTLDTYVEKYKISNIQNIKINKSFFTIYGDVEYNLYHINSYKEVNIDNSRIIKFGKYNKLTIFNSIKDKSQLLKYINTKN